MKTGVTLAILFLAAIGAGAWLLISARNQPPAVAFVKVLRETIADAVPTNGKVEPIEWAEARAERGGPVEAILVQRGQRVEKGAELVDLDSSEAKADLASAQSRVTQAHAELEVLDRGGRAADLTVIAGEIDRVKLELASAQKDYDSLLRLQSKQAATGFEVAQAKDRVDRAQAQIRALEQRRAALVAPPDRTSAEARLHDAEAAVALAQERILKSAVRAPISGTIYQFDVKPGAYLNAGDLVAALGELARVRVKVFVDEPDLGRVSRGMPVAITWDAMPGRQWKGSVDRTPTQIVALGTRQVGEVMCIIDNREGELLPGTNVNVEIRSQVVADALTLPKEAIQRQGGQTGVFALNGSAVAWKKIGLGVANTTRTQVDGLNEGDAVALPSEKPLKDGMLVAPQFP
ncbi:MAG TPA: efflux RND transporter periplasmic adaptor subunit [Bryobacteraceae bacterium]|nr:efflux RND transporter periplasmic adaptor subunit [Bryobacteraceae bacterium]